VTNATLRGILVHGTDQRAVEWAQTPEIPPSRRQMVRGGNQTTHGLTLVRRLVRRKDHPQCLGSSW
jgi:hypothetical protein